MTQKFYFISNTCIQLDEQLQFPVRASCLQCSFLMILRKMLSSYDPYFPHCAARCQNFLLQLAWVLVLGSLHPNTFPHLAQPLVITISHSCQLFQHLCKGKCSIFLSFFDFSDDLNKLGFFKIIIKVIVLNQVFELGPILD